jgi:hypothetical protein
MARISRNWAPDNDQKCILKSICKLTLQDVKTFDYGDFLGADYKVLFAITYDTTIINNIVRQ